METGVPCAVCGKLTFALGTLRCDACWLAESRLEQYVQTPAGRRNVETMLYGEPLQARLKWVAQTVHQAHHEGTMDACLKVTCTALRECLVKP